MTVHNRWATGRTEAFSDGVFAIAITLLVLDIHVPLREFHDLWKGIASEWPSYLGYVTSFMAVGGMWLAHHAIFRRLSYVNEVVMRLNLVLLMAISFLPFPTGLAAQAVHSESAERAAVIFYGATLLVINVLLAALWSAVASDRSLLRDDVDQEEIGAIARAASPNIAFYLAATGFALVAPRVAAIGFLVIAARGVLQARGDTTTNVTPREQSA
jgi:uncharacterized membrane protein